MLNDFIIFFLLISIIAITVFVTEKISSKVEEFREISRKILHIVAMVCAAVSVIIIDSYWILLISGLTATLITFWAVKSNLLPGVKPLNRQSWGIFFFPLGFTILLILIDQSNYWLIFISFLVLAFADSTAAMIGETFESRRFSITTDSKSVLGSTMFFLISIMVLLILISNSELFIANTEILLSSELYTFYSVLIISVILTCIEAFSSNGSDNLFVPLFCVLLLEIFFRAPNEELLINFSLAMLLAVFVSVGSLRLKFLTESGAVSVFLLATFIFGLGGVKWSVPILTFFILSSILSKFRKRRNSKIDEDFEKSGIRDYFQVLANGGIGGVLVIVNYFYPSENLFYFYLASLAAVCADTWATEIGTMVRGRTFNITNLHEVKQGISGGISFWGTIGALLGALSISLSGSYWMNNLIPNFGLVLFSGVFGCFFDSFLGATLQLQYRCIKCGKLTEKEIHCKISSEYEKGITWIKNDFVNLLAGISGILAFISIIGII